MGFQRKSKPWKFDKAKQMRKNPTKGESEMWELLKEEKSGARFQRQSVILGYIVDFWCPRLKVVVEVDGPQHKLQEAYDENRDNVLWTKLNITTLRFSTEELSKDKTLVIKKIKAIIKALSS